MTFKDFIIQVVLLFLATMCLVKMFEVIARSNAAPKALSGPFQPCVWPNPCYEVNEA